MRLSCLWRNGRLCRLCGWKQFRSLMRKNAGTLPHSCACGYETDLSLLSGIVPAALVKELGARDDGFN